MASNPHPSPRRHSPPSSPPPRALAQRPVAGLPTGYPALLADIKARIHTAQTKAALAVNRELISLYWRIGRDIVTRQRAANWGTAVVARLAADIQRAFPGIGGFSPQNIWYMRAFYLAWTNPKRKLQQPVGETPDELLQQPVGEIPWGHNIVLLTKLKTPAAWAADNNQWTKSQITNY